MVFTVLFLLASLAYTIYFHLIWWAEETRQNREDEENWLP